MGNPQPATGRNTAVTTAVCASGAYFLALLLHLLRHSLLLLQQLSRLINGLLKRRTPLPPTALYFSNAAGPGCIFVSEICASVFAFLMACSAVRGHTSGLERARAAKRRRALTRNSAFAPLDRLAAPTGSFLFQCQSVPVPTVTSDRLQANTEAT
jgi:hypothetical protein